MADLSSTGVRPGPKWYEGKYEKSELLEEPSRRPHFFPALGEKGVCCASRRGDPGYPRRDHRRIETLEDITERKSRNCAPREREQLFSIIEGSPIPTS